MRLNQLIKEAIDDKGLREQLLNNPEEVLAKRGMPFIESRLEMHVFHDETNMQGGYRP